MQDDKNAIFQMRFPQKLWYLLSMRKDAILWGGTGRTILINYRVLLNYLQGDRSIFKTTNISSFVRQLNLYGFRKVTSHLQDPLCNSSNPYMHEYVHEYFQFGHPEWLNKITRKALALKKTYKSRNIHPEQRTYTYITPLQKARRALHSALRKAAQDIFIHNSSKELCNLKFEYDDVPEDCEDEENVEFDWILPKNVEPETEQSLPQAVNLQVTSSTINEDSNHFGESSQDLMNFNDEAQQNNDSFPGQFLSMPELDAEPTEQNSGVELLAEFNIHHDNDQGITRKIGNKNDHSLNCVLPSISNDQNDYVSMDQNDNNDTDHYNDGEWDQMFNDIIASKGSNQECSSDLKELYSHISRTIDLLNP